MICYFLDPSYGPQREKTCLRAFSHREVHTSLLNYRDYQENWNFTCDSKFRYNYFQKANNNVCYSVCADAQAGLCLCCSQTIKDRISPVKARTIYKQEYF